MSCYQLIQFCSFLVVIAYTGNFLPTYFQAFIIYMHVITQIG